MTQQSDIAPPSGRKKRLSIYLDPNLSHRLADHAGRREQSRSMIAEAAIAIVDAAGHREEAFRVAEERKMTWTILPDKQKIGNWETQKATTEFAGRKWTAWFCSDIPIQDGPYKFSGLPGLVVKLEDDTHSHLYNLIAIKNLGVLEPEIYAFQISKEIPLKSAEYKKLLLEHRKDPAKGLRQISMDNGVVLNMANSAENDKFLKEREERLKEQIKKDNNLIEIDLLK